jgi:arsenite methyltransferase
MRREADYGVDAPGVIRNLLLAGACGIALALFSPALVVFGTLQFKPRPMGWSAGVACFVSGLLMLLYSKVGKLRHRERMLNLHQWRGDESVLDVGTGRGLLLVGAAHRLTTGHAVGIDIWNQADLSDNALERTERILASEGVAAKCTLISESVDKMSFADERFDVILSNLCLHNIYQKPARMKACQEIARVLKPGGLAIISDYKLTAEYAGAFRQAGLTVERMAPNFLTTYPPLRIVIARKPR